MFEVRGGLMVDEDYEKEGMNSLQAIVLPLYRSACVLLCLPLH